MSLETEQMLNRLVESHNKKIRDFFNDKVGEMAGKKTVQGWCDLFGGLMIMDHDGFRHLKVDDKISLQEFCEGYVQSTIIWN